MQVAITTRTPHHTTFGRHHDSATKFTDFLRGDEGGDPPRPTTLSASSDVVVTVELTPWFSRRARFARGEEGSLCMPCSHKRAHIIFLSSKLSPTPLLLCPDKEKRRHPAEPSFSRLPGLIRGTSLVPVSDGTGRFPHIVQSASANRNKQAHETKERLCSRQQPRPSIQSVACAPSFIVS